MPVACPKCGRPNSDASAKCVYCASNLEGAKIIEISDRSKKLAKKYLDDLAVSRKTETNNIPPPKTTSTQKPVSQPGDKRGNSNLKLIRGGVVSSTEPTDSFWVISASDKMPDDETINQAAKVIGKDYFWVRNMIASQAPWVIKRFKDEAPAKEISANLEKIGLRSYVLTELEFNQVPPRLAVKKVSLISGGLNFEGAPKRIPIEIRWDQAFLMILGKIRRRKSDLSKKSRNKISESKPDVMLKEYQIADIFLKDGTGVRIAEGITDFSGLGEYMTPSSIHNIKWIVDGYKSASNVFIDDGYRNLSMVFKPASSTQPGKKPIPNLLLKDDVLDNASHFDEYSSLSFVHRNKK